MGAPSAEFSGEGTLWDSSLLVSLTLFQGKFQELEIVNGGVPGGVFCVMISELDCLCEEICYCKKFLLQFDTPLAIATSGSNTNLLLQEPPPPSENPPI